MSDLPAASLSEATLTQARAQLTARGFVALDAPESLESGLDELRGLIQDALLIEHATIPVYLTMLYTLQPPAPWRVLECVRSVVVEEMLHFTLAGNLLNAVGGAPAIYSPDFMPDYPAWLPHKVDNLQVRLLGFSREAVDQGLDIERAAYIKAESVLRGVHEGMTIGEYYTLIASKLVALAERYGEDAVFCGDPARQVPPEAYYYDGGGDVIEVRDLASALAAIEQIKDQGEGAHRGIWTGEESQALGGYPEVAHYFRFDELARGRLYVPGDTIESGPTGEPLEVPWDQAVQIVSDAKLSDYPEDSPVRAHIEAFNTAYCTILALLQRAFSGEPDLLVQGVVRMCALREDFTRIVRNPFPGRDGFNAAPTFEFVPGLEGSGDTPDDTPQQTPSDDGPKCQGGASNASDDSANAATLQALQDAYGNGDLDAALACMAPDVIWDISGPPSVPYAGVFYGHAGFSDFWNKLGQTVVFERAGVQTTFMQGDQAVALGGESGKTTATNAPYHYDWAIAYRFGPDHLITSMRQYYDPSRIQAALAGPDYPNTAPPPPGDSTVTDDITQGQPLPAIPEGFTMPFYYSSLTNVGVYYLVPIERVATYLDGTGLTAARFEGDTALVSFNFQLYTGQFAAGLNVPPDQWPTSGAGITQELELNIVAFPTAQVGRVAQVSFEQFVLGDEQSKLMGNHRVHVPCDADVAIAAGKTLFGEPKFKTSFRVNLSSPNPVRENTTPYQPEWVKTWGFRVDDPNDPSQDIFTCIVDLNGLKSYPGNISPITEYGTFEGRLIGCRWNLLEPADTVFLDDATASRVALTYGVSDHPMQADMKALLGGCKPRAVRTFNSSSAAIQSRAYYP